MVRPKEKEHARSQFVDPHFSSSPSIHSRRRLSLLQSAISLFTATVRSTPFVSNHER